MRNTPRRRRPSRACESRSEARLAAIWHCALDSIVRRRRGTERCRNGIAEITPQKPDSHSFHSSIVGYGALLQAAADFMAKAPDSAITGMLPICIVESRSATFENRNTKQ